MTSKLGESGMSENWQPMYFSEFVEINPAVQLPKDQELPYVEMADVTPGRRYVTAKQMRRPRGGARFRDGDTLFARITPCLENGKIAQYVSKGNTLAFGSTEFFVFRAKSGVSDRDYVCYLAMTDLVRKPAEKSMAGASGRQRADIRAIENLKVHVPSLPIQRKITSILSAYDDLIENNTRRIKILEEMAQSIYREWFVRFRFPGHEKVKMVDSLLGKIPSDWEILPIGNAIETLGGGTPSKKTPEYWEPAEVTWFTPSDLTASKSMFMFDSSGKISLEGLIKVLPSYFLPIQL
jgi:type I restriction enzyme, S subunit